jgi:putative oxidoreductase
MDRARGMTGGVMWAVSVLLAGIFIMAGVPKVIGTGTLWLQASAMHGFPGWIRVLVGTFEVVGGVALLVPTLASYGALGLGILMVPAAITQAMSGEPGVYVPILLLALLVAVGWLRDPATMRGLYRGVVEMAGPVVREGAIAGAIGATCVALWFFIVDIVAGHPLFTPIALGEALMTVFRPTPADAPAAVAVIAYTLFHYAAFIAVGILAADVVAWAGREPALLLGFVILFVAFEVGFYGFVALLQQSTRLGELAWSQVMVGNLISAAAMGAYIWRAHPRLHEQFAHALD